MARRRDYAAEYARRQARARSLGFRGYYERRTRTEPGAAKPPVDVLARRRGHRSYADLLRQIKTGRVEVIAQFPHDRDRETGTYESVELDILLADGRTQNYVLRGRDLQGDRIRELRRALARAGSDVYVSPSIDILSLGAEVDVVGVDEEDLRFEESA